MTVFVGLTNPKSATNVGSVMRAAGCYSVDKVYYTGTRYDRSVRLNTDTKKMTSSIPLEKTDDFIALKNASKTESLTIVCVDLIEGATPLPNFIHPKNAFYIFGPEDSTIKQSVINQSDSVVYIPTKGCMNLAATVNVLLYDRLSKSKVHQLDNDLIRASRDNNNHVKMKGKN